MTEFVTGLSARVGLPNEHLAGGHAEALMNPMYSTCIGLILRGYHDYENGRMRFTGQGGNYMHVPGADIDKIDLEPIAVENEIPPLEHTDEEPQEIIQQKEVKPKNDKRNEKVKGMFNMLKGKFISMFEDVDDQIIE
jgi:cell division protein FtsA